MSLRVAMRALRLYAGPLAARHLQAHGLSPADVRVIPGAAGGPKGLILGPLDRWLFGQWLAGASHPVDLVGASIGAWRMATACLPDAVAAFERLERDYIAQHYDPPPGRRRPSAEQVSGQFAAGLREHFGGHEATLIAHPRYRLHIVTSRGRGVLARDGRWRTPLGYAGAWLSNAISRRAMGAWLDRVVFSSPGAALPFATRDYPTHHIALGAQNLLPALQASCAIPFALQAVHDVPGGPAGAYWDGGITDYHLHLDTRALDGLVLYPHFQRQVVPGWLDKAWKRRHAASAFLDRVLLICPDPQWVRGLPNGKLPDRQDFLRYGSDWRARARVWQAAARASEQLAEEWARWVEQPDLSRLEVL